MGLERRGGEAEKSAAMAASTLNTIAMSNPAKTNGSAYGKVTNRKVCQRVALKDRIRSSLGASTVLRPTMTLTSTGKNATNAAMTIFDERPKPSQTTSSGATAIFGSVWSATTYG